MTNPENYLIARGIGWGDVFLGATKNKVESFLSDEGVITSKFDDVYFADYLECGIQISYFTHGDTVNCIFFYNQDENYEHMIGLPIKTNENIGWESTPFDVKEAYGKPWEYFSGTKDGIFWERIVYNGIDFRFLNKKLVRISIMS